MKSLRPSGGYRRLGSFQMTTIIYDATVWFCQAFLDARSRTVDQMVQAARSGRQNIAEGSRAAATSTASEIKLTNVARASLEELLLDYEDFLRQNRMTLWDRNSDESMQVRNRGGNREELRQLSDTQRWELYAPWLEHPNSTVRANAIICLIHQANYMLDRQLLRLQRNFVEQGGYSEQLAAARFEFRSNQSNDPAPKCPQCKSLMSIKTARSGKNAGTQFWGCAKFPGCTGTRPLE